MPLLNRLYSQWYFLFQECETLSRQKTRGFFHDRKKRLIVMHGMFLKNIKWRENVTVCMCILKSGWPLAMLRNDIPDTRNENKSFIFIFSVRLPYFYIKGKSMWWDQNTVSLILRETWTTELLKWKEIILQTVTQWNRVIWKIMKVLLMKSFIHFSFWKFILKRNSHTSSKYIQNFQYLKKKMTTTSTYWLNLDSQQNSTHIFFFFLIFITNCSWIVVIAVKEQII